MLGMGPTELIVIIILALVIFGPRRLPEIMQYVGKAINQVKELTGGIQDAVTKDIIQPITEDLIKPVTDIKNSVINKSIDFADVADDSKSSQASPSSHETEGSSVPK